MKPSQKLLLCLIAAALTLLWGQLISDLRGKEPESVSIQTRYGERAIARKSEMSISDLDVDSKIKDLSIAIKAAELVNQRCNPSSTISYQECIDNIRDDEYYSAKAILPLLEELSTPPTKAKEISYKLIRTAAGEVDLTSKTEDNFYCINPALSAAEKLILTSAIEPAGITQKADDLILGMRNKICKAYVRF